MVQGITDAFNISSSRVDGCIGAQARCLDMNMVKFPNADEFLFEFSLFQKLKAKT